MTPARYAVHFKSALLCMSALGALSVPAVAQAQDAATAEAARDFDVPAQPLARALSAIAEQANIQVVYPDKEPLSIDAPAVRGRMTTSQALAAALAGSGYSYRWLRDGVVTLVSGQGSGDGERVTGAVRVEGAQRSPYFGGAGVAAGVNGVNGSRDITATEGTGSFTSGALTIGSKVPQAMKDVPQSLSVMTNERLVQQNVTDFTTAMRQLPGVTFVQGASTLLTNFYSRGFLISSVQIDGGAPLTLATGYYPEIDMSIYDHVELLRGAAGLFNGYGEASGVVNLVRKKPLDHAQYVLEAKAGSWSNYRVVADATAPLAFNGELRGRLVTTYQDNHYFYKLAKDNKQLIYGIAELDMTSTTLLSVGINYTRQNNLPFYGGLPRYQTGEDLKLPRSTSFALPWNRWSVNTTEIFGALEQKIGKEWSFKLNLTHIKQSSTRKFGYSNNAVNPDNLRGPVLLGTYADSASEQLLAEAVMTGAFEIFGQRQEVTIGANHSSNDAAGIQSYNTLIASSAAAPYQPYVGGPRYCFTTSTSTPCPAGTIAPATPPIDVFNFDPYAAIYAEPGNPLVDIGYGNLGTIQSGIYMNLRLTAFDRLHLLTGLRWSSYKNNRDQLQFCRNTTGACLGKQIGDLNSRSTNIYSDTDFSWPPPVNLSLDVTKQLTAYLGYTDIYQSQSRLVDGDRNPIGPITGANLEAGLKWAAQDGRLNVALSAYRIKKSGVGVLDPTYPRANLDNSLVCCYFRDSRSTAKSQGFDVEVTGEILQGWQLAASYSYNDNSQIGGANDGQPLLSIQPKNLYKLWTNYDFGAAGATEALSGLAISGGVNGQSSAYFAGTGCKPEYIVTNAATGAATCGTIGGVSGTYSYNFTVPSYAVFSGRIDYRFSDKWALAVNLENILDKTYYQTTGSGVIGGNWYGTPRSVTATLRAKW